MWKGKWENFFLSAIKSPDENFLPFLFTSLPPQVCFYHGQMMMCFPEGALDESHVIKTDDDDYYTDDVRYPADV